MALPRLLFCIATVLPLSAQIFSAGFPPPNIPGASFFGVETERMEGTDGAVQQGIPVRYYRDSAGRTRREFVNSDGVPSRITIVDPVAGFRYEIYVNRKRASRYTLPPRRDEPAHLPPAGLVIIPRAVGIIYKDSDMDGAVQGIGVAGGHFHSTSELLGTAMIEGVPVEGERIITTLEPGAVGNDQEIVVNNERWFSKQLRVLVWSRLSDPRFGVRTRTLNEIKLTEPEPSLFEPPADYVIQEMGPSNP